MSHTAHLTITLKKMGLNKTRMRKLGANYTFKENSARVLWGGVSIFFRYSPRLFYSWRNFLLRIFGARIGKGVKIFPSAKIMFPWNLEIADGTVVSWEVILYNLGKITIGSNTVISQYAHICAGTHEYTSEEFTLLKSSVEIGSKVWVAADAFVGPDVTVGDGVVVGSRSVVINDVPDHTVVAGNPARIIKKIM